jgi:hypothetical protein
LLPITQHDVEHSPNFAQFLIERATSRPFAPAATQPFDQPSPPISAQTDLYAIFLDELDSIGVSIGYAEQAVAAHFHIELVQARAWLLRARKEGRIPAADDVVAIVTTENH